MPPENPSAEDRLEITSAPFAEGRERSCYLHPRDPSRVVKISRGAETSQSRREAAFFERFRKRGITDYTHLPRYYGTVATNLGEGLVLELIRDADGEVSKPLNWYIKNGISRDEVETLLHSLRQYLLHNLIIFNHDLNSGNMLLRKAADGSASLVVIDGLGDVIAIQWLNRIPAHARAKIERRWDKLMKRFYENNFLCQGRGEKS